MKREEIDPLFERAVDAVRATDPGDDAVAAAARRTWERLSMPAASPEPASLVGPIAGCAGFQSLLPAYLAGQLPPSRALLVQEHLRECVPCRRAQKRLQSGETAAETAAAMPASTHRPVWRLAAAAVLVCGLGFASWTALRYLPASGQEATVAALDGTALRVADTELASLRLGDRIPYGEPIRTARLGHAVVRLHDGTEIEMRERSEVAVRERRGETAIQLARGEIIVHAAKQRQKHLYVVTDSSEVAVTGTIFAVHAGTKGSRVSVVEGEVHVTQRDGDHVLHGGDQVTSSPRLERVAVAKEIAWSRDAERYRAILAELGAVRDEIAAAVPAPDLRHATTLLDELPASTAVYVAVPNIAASVDQAYAIFRDRVAASDVLRPWWQEQTRNPEVDEELQKTFQNLRDLGGYVGDEVVVALLADAQGDVQAPLATAELRRSGADLRSFLEQQAAEHAGAAEHLVFVDDPASLPATYERPDGGSEALYVWIRDGRVAASPAPAAIRALASGPALAGAFHDRIAAAYADGVQWLVAADLGRMMQGEPSQNADFAMTGLTDLDSLLLESKEVDGRATTHGTVSFRGARHGMASWLAAPSPMGGLDFVSADASLVSAFAIKEPRAVVDDLLAMTADEGPEHLAEIEKDLGLSIREDLAGPLGGEVVLALDGPVAPTPAWKVVVEVYDPQRFEATMARLVEAIDRHAREAGEVGYAVTDETDGGLTFHTVQRTDGRALATFAVTDGYAVFAPQRALVERALDYRRSGANLRHAATFTALLPFDGEVDLSGFVYHNLGPVLQPVGQLVAQSPAALSPEQRSTFAALGGSLAPSLAWAYATEDHIEMATSGQKGLFGLDLGNFFGLGAVLHLADVANLAGAAEQGATAPGSAAGAVAR